MGKRYTIYYGAAKAVRLGERQYNLHDFAVRNPGWHTLGGSGSPKSYPKLAALSLERLGLLELAKHSGDYGRDWQFRTNWSK